MFGEWLSLVEHLVRDQGVGASNPLSPTILYFGPIEDQIKGSLCMSDKTYSINGIAQKCISEQSALPSGLRVRTENMPVVQFI